MNSYGFIIIRHVNSEITNKYWNNSIICLRKYYPHKKIIIIDDNSNQELIKADFDYKNIEIIQSEFHGRGELLPYYYYLKNKFFENAIIIHDSVFFHKRINFEKLLGVNVIPLWFFYPDKENINNTLRISHKLKNNFDIKKNLLIKEDNLLFKIQRDSEKWYGCFGVQSFINHSFLTYLENKYNFTNMIQSINCRADRCCLERIFGCLFFYEYQQIINIKSLFGNIMKYQTWGYSYEDYMNDKKKGVLPKSIIKVWTGR